MNFHQFDPKTLGELRYQLAQLQASAARNAERAAGLTLPPGVRPGTNRRLAINSMTTRAQEMTRRAADYELLLTLGGGGMFAKATDPDDDPDDDSGYCNCAMCDLCPCGCTDTACQCIHLCVCGPACHICDKEPS